MGFEHFAYKGLETGSREMVSHVIRQDKVYILTVLHLRVMLNQITINTDIPNLNNAINVISQILFAFESALNPGNEGKSFFWKVI